MKIRRIYYIPVVVSLVALLFYGLLTSTRHIDMTFMQEGTPLADCELFVTFSTKDNQPKTFLLDREGNVRIPDSYAGHRAVYAIIRNGEVIHEVDEPEFRRGITSVDFQSTGIESTHRYRFLFYDSTSKLDTISLIK